MARVRVVSKVDRRRREPDRRSVARGGRRATDRGGRLATGACDGCGRRDMLHWIRVTATTDEFVCHACRCRVFFAR